MGIEDVFHHLEVFVSRGAFVVDDDIVTVRPVGVVVNRQWRIDAFVIGPPDIDLDIGPRLDAFVKSEMLALVIVTAAAPR